MYKIKKNNIPDKEIRYSVIDELEKISLEDNSVVILDADLMSPSGTVNLMNKNSNRVFNLGVMEANMVGVSSGLSHVGLKPFLHTFAPFAARKCLDQIFLTSTYSNTPITMLSTDPGLCAQTNGGTHTSLEDIGIFNSFYNAKIYDICDAVQAKWVIQDRVKNHQAFGYCRYPRRPLKAIYEEGSQFGYGKAPIVFHGNDVGIFASGIMLSVAIDVVEELKESNISVKLLDCFSLSDPDVNEIVQTAESCKYLFSLDNHNIKGGLGSIVSDVLTQHAPCKLHKIGVKKYGQVGSLVELLKEYQLDAKSIVKQIKNILKI